MILGLDHLSLNCREKKFYKKKILNYNKLYDIKALNHKEKKKFISKKIKNHCITFFTSKKNLPSIEKTYYGKNKINSKKIKIKKNEIFLSVLSKNKEFLFWKKVFNLKRNKNRINLFSLYDQKKYKFYFNEENTSKEYLDYIGYTSICFISNDINKLYKSCKAFNLEMSRIFNYKINQKKMKIFFFRSPGDLIFEIVQYLL